MDLPEVCVVYLLRPDGATTEVLLGVKLTGLGKGKLVGPGGKIEQGESVHDAAVREVQEEVGVRIEASDLMPAGRLDYHFPSKPSWSQRSHVFRCTRWSGEPTASAELAPRWFALEDVPYARMWDDAARWLPAVLRGGTVEETFTFGHDLETVVEALRD